MNAAQAIASNLYECPICFDAMCKQKVCGFARADGTRSCRHLFHTECVPRLARCPLCNTDFEETVEMPDPILHGVEWFRFIDVDNTESLTCAEIIEALKASLSMDWKKIEADVNRLFVSWDRTDNGRITLEEFIDPSGGLLRYVTTHLTPPGAQPLPPDIRNKLEWFSFWDEDGSRSLDKSELCRAIVKTFRHMDNQHAPKEIAAMLDVVWPIFDSDGSGEIEIEEFCAPDNLGDTILAEMLNDER